MNQGVAFSSPDADDFLNPHSGATSLGGATPQPWVQFAKVLVNSGPY